MAPELISKEDGVVNKVNIIKKTNVLPSKKIGRKECPLVTFDLPYVTFYYNQKLLLYKGADFQQVVEKLKEGLAVVLEEFYPLAGRLQKDEEGVLRVVCDDDENVGVEFIEAVAKDIDIDELAKEEASSILHQINPYTNVMNLEGLHRPLLVVQVTKLKDGIAIGCGVNHAVLDGNSTWHFMNSWAEICRGSTAISVIPFHDRIKARNTRVKLDLPKSAEAHERSGESNGDAKPAPLLREKIFRFSETAVNKIKSEVNSNVTNGTTKSFSTFQSLGVHLWRAVTRARQLKPEDYTVFAVFMDCRKRVDPPMPDNYFGNLIQAVFTVTAAGLLLASPPEFGATMLQNVIQSHDSKAINKRSEEWEAEPKLFRYKDAGINPVAIGSSPRFQVYDVDFGWGKPEAVRSGSNNKFDGMVYLYQGKGGSKGIDVEVTLEAEAMEHLEKDKMFLMEV
ncbi:Bahd acyltransferase dcr [Thalictrum thalictroides]|uniref:Bahd acyltransferase dcr n=1 Tax=Thalictrum thalictroides TaxID=46969 RepID=A0A7J6UYX7_THATH|nr:Bahd acyltransferase dcr [Thalictrum thalictroides]